MYSILMKTKIFCVISLIIVLFLAACNTTTKTNSINSVQSLSNVTTKNDVSNNEAVIISINNFQFNPTSITIKAGTKVRWINQDSTIHTIKSNEFNSDKLGTGKDFEFMFSKPGTYDYVCGIHSSMKGRIIVE